MGKLSDLDISRLLFDAGQTFEGEAETEIGERVLDVVRGELGKAFLLMEVAAMVHEEDAVTPPERDELP